MAKTFFNYSGGGQRIGFFAGLSILVLCFGFAAVLTTGCGGASAQQIQLLRSEIFTLKQKQRQLSHELTALDSLLRRRVQALDEFSANFGSDIRQVTERLSVIEQRLADTEQRMIRLQSAINSAVSGSAVSRKAEGKRSERVSPKEVFNLAYEDFTSANYQMAIEGFRDFLQRFPDSPLGQEAYFYIGRSYQALKNYEKAMSSFRTIVDKYPDSPLYPDALFKIGDCLINLGDKSRGETYFQTVIQRFPDSNAAALARARLNP